MKDVTYDISVWKSIIKQMEFTGKDFILKIALHDKIWRLLNGVKESDKLTIQLSDAEIAVLPESKTE